MQWLCSQLCYLTAANQRTIVEIELLPTVGWQWGCQPFSCRCSQNMTHWQEEICSTSLSKESIPTIPFGNLNHPLPARSRFLRAAVRSTCFALWLHHAHPFVAVAWKTCLIEISRVFGQRVMASRFVTMQWLCSQLCCEIAANQRTLVEIELLATVGWKWGCQPFSCRCSQNVTHCPKEICSTSLSKESIPTILLGISIIHSLPEASGSWERQYAPPALQWLHPAHPFVAATEKNVPHAEKQSVCSRSCGSQDLLQCSDCALSCAVRLLQTNEHLSRLSF